jgi:hypothetical protein
VVSYGTVVEKGAQKLELRSDANGWHLEDN